jgi:hypothetical protein
MSRYPIAAHQPQSIIRESSSAQVRKRASAQAFGEGGPASAQARVRQYVALTKQKCNTHSVPRIAKELQLTFNYDGILWEI